MSNYKIDMVTERDINTIVDIYNSNTIFLENHIGDTTVSKEFILNEIKEMENMGFNSVVIRNEDGNIVGVCDYSIQDEVYLSLLMIDAKQKRNGLGSRIYNNLERIFKLEYATRVRIDVVYDYEDNVVGFWEKQGFIRCEEIELEWNGYKSNAIKMYKNI